ncbi:MAG TPA: tetratricopeptide repeat protein [Elainellaceae cyanobacterium]
MTISVARQGFRIVGMSMLVGTLVSSTSVASTSADEYRQRGLALRQQGRLDEAIATLKQSVSLAPDHVSGHVILGWTQHLAGQDDDAADTLVQAFYTDPFAVPTLNALGIVYLTSDKLSYALTTHLWATVLYPENEIAYFNLSLAQHRLGYYDWAIATANKAAELEPDNPHPFIAKAIAHYTVGAIALAQAEYKRAIALRPWFATGAIELDLENAAFSPEQIKLAKEIQRESQTDVN